MDKESQNLRGGVSALKDFTDKGGGFFPSLCLFLLYEAEKFMEKIMIRCEKILTYIAVLSIFVMMLLTSADAIGRYLFNSPIAGAYEVTEKYLMLIAVYLGASFTYREGSNIRIGLVIDRLPRQVRMGLNLFAQVFSICYGICVGCSRGGECFPNLS